MATYTISVNERTNSGKALMAYLQQSGVLVDKVLVPRKKADPTRMTRKEFFERIEDASKGTGKSFDDVLALDDYIRSL